MQTELFVDPLHANTSLLTSMLNSADRLFVKKLSNNDREWAQKTNLHQAGVYIPPLHRDGGFFPSLSKKVRSDPNAAEIREVFFSSKWPQTGDILTSRLVHYTSKGPETHLTRVPKEAFQELLPASLLVIGRVPESGVSTYVCLTIQSGSEEQIMLFDILGLDGNFHVGEFDPKDQMKLEQDLLLEFADQVVNAWLKGDIEVFAEKNAIMPSTAVLAEMARRKFLELHELTDLNPFELKSPGDALREISRTIEWEMFREFQRRERAVALVRILMGDQPHELGATAIIRRLVEKLHEVDALMLSASQQRKSRAGYSYEHQIEAMLLAGKIPHEKQVVIEARKRPDFILPSLALLKKPREAAAAGLIISAKTTLRERWKQVQSELTTGKLYLATVDENIAGNAIEDMATLNITLLIPESLKESKDTEYGKYENVMGFKTFVTEIIQNRLAGWKV